MGTDCQRMDAIATLDLLKIKGKWVCFATLGAAVVQNCALF
jgi:hypothetical protein